MELGDYLAWVTRLVPPPQVYDAHAFRRVFEMIVTQWGGVYRAGVPRHRQPF
jgi:hypothetical protein